MAGPQKKGKKKRFIKVLAPKLFASQLIGESPVYEAKDLLGRRINVNLMALTNNPKNQNIQVRLEITSSTADSVGSEIIGYRLLPSFVRRMVRKGKNRIDDTVYLESKDGIKVKVSPFFLTLNKASKSVLTAVRAASKQVMQEKFSQMAYEEIFNEIVQRKLQMSLKKDMGKVYPLRQCEIRSIQIAKGQKPPVGKGVKAPKKVEKPKVEEKPEVAVEA